MRSPNGLNSFHRGCAPHGSGGEKSFSVGALAPAGSLDGELGRKKVPSSPTPHGKGFLPFLRLFFLFLIFLLPQFLLADAQIKITYPREKARISYVKNSFVFGAVTPASATLIINGSTVPVYRTGSFLGYIPFQTGDFAIRARAASDGLSTETVRTLFVSSPEIALPLEPLQIVLDSIQPALDIKALPQEPILLRFKGTPQCRAEYRLKNWKSKEWKNRWRPMFENSSSSGVYESFLTIPPPEEQNYTPETGGSVVFRLTNSIGKKVQAFSPGYFEILKPEDFVWYETQAEETVLRTGPGAGSEQMGYDLFLPKGVKLKQNGQIGKELRFHLSSAISGWTDLKNVKKIREPVSELRAVLESVKAKGLKRRTLLRCALSGKVPYRVHVSNDLKTVSVLFFKTLSNLDRIRYEDDLSLKTVGTIQWIQANEETVEILCDLKEKLWGYEARYEDDRFVLELIFSPPPIQNRQNPLSQLKVVVDPGHSLEMGDGAISPQGILEGEINYAIALRLKESLESMGSKVILTRRKNELVSLQERARRAKTERADLYISIHANALPDGANPFERHGFSVFYFHPFSFDFARSVHAAYKQRIPLSDDGLYYGNLAVCRIPQMPAILTESAYLIHPEEEELLSSEDFQRSLAQTITEGALDFLKSW